MELLEVTMAQTTRMTQLGIGMKFMLLDDPQLVVREFELCTHGSILLRARMHESRANQEPCKMILHV